MGLNNSLSYRVQIVMGTKTEKFKRKLDEWLRVIPETPRIDDYGVSVGMLMNSTVKHGELDGKLS